MSSRQPLASAVPSVSTTGGRLARWLRVWLLGLVPALLAAATPAPAFALLRCNYTGAVLASCCCPKAELDEQTGPRLSRQHCCSVERTDGSPPAGVGTPDPLAPPVLALPRAWPTASLPAQPAPRIGTTPALRRLRHRQESRAGPSRIIVYRRLLL